MPSSRYNLGCTIILTLLYTSLYTQAHTISGYISDASSSEQLISAHVYDFESASGTVSNNFGFYSLTLPAGTINLRASYIGFGDVNINFELTKDTTINFKLPSSFELEEVVITADETSDGNIEERTQMSTIDVPVEQIKKIPALLGEVDVIKALQLLPGVQSGGEGQSGLYVRGGSPDQNLILLDGVPVYNANHLFGFFSVFNADAIKDVKLVKGGFPARYGGRLSSVLEINLKEGNRNEFHGEGSIGLISSKLTLEGPITDRTSFIVSGRRTYIDILAKPFINSSFRNSGQDGSTGYFFYDLNAKVNHTFSKNDKLYISTYTGKDKFYLNSKELDQNPANVVDFGLGWGNFTTAVRWNHLFNPKLFGNLTATLSDYKFDVLSSFGEEYIDPSLNELFSLEYDSGIRDYALKLDFDYLPNPEHFIKFGINGIQHSFNPGTFDLKFEDPSSENIDVELSQEKVNAKEIAAYIEDDMELSDRFKVNAGLHASAFFVDGEDYFSLQPRISSRYLLDNGLAIKTSFASMAQYIHLLSNEGIGLPTDLWLPSTARVKPQTSWQVATGIAKTIGESYEVSLEGYYKKMNNLIAYEDGSGLFEFSDWQDRIVTGRGTSYGIEAFIQKKKGRFTGWIGYTWSQSKRQFDDLNFGKEFPYKYDRRHDLSVVGIYSINEQWSLSGTWVYGTGNAVTLGNSNYISLYDSGLLLTGQRSSFYEDRNNFRLNPYHRLDIGATYTKKKKGWNSVWSFGAYNAYNRKNPFFIFTDTIPLGTETRTILKQASLFPIIPYVTYSFEF